MGIVNTIPRGRVYHPLSQELSDIFRAFFSRRDLHKVPLFEKRMADYMNSRHCFTFSFARTAFYFSLKAAKIPPHSEIIMPPITIKPFLDMLLSLKLKPVFVDLDPDTLCYNCEELEKAITENTKAINITYLFGIVPNMDRLIGIARKNNLFIIEDYSHNINAEFKGQKLGTFGDVGIYSASSTKTFDIHGAGLLVTENDEIAKSIKMFQEELVRPSRIFLVKKIINAFIRNLFSQRLIFSFITFPLINLLKIISSDEVIKFTGTRSKEQIKTIPQSWLYAFDPLQAEFAFRELKALEKNDSRRIRNVRLIKHLLGKNNKHIKYPVDRKDSKCVFWQFGIYSADPLHTQNILHQHNVDSATTSLIVISSLPNYQYRNETPVAQNIHDNFLIIPAFPGLNKKDIKVIGKALQALQ